MTNIHEFEPLIVASSCKIGVLAVEQDEIGAPSRRNGADRAGACLRTRGERRVEQRPPDRAAITPGEDVARTVGEPLAVFELTQFCGRVDLDVGIGADAEASASREIARAVEYAVAERGFGERAEPSDCSGPRQCLGLAGRHVGRVNQAPATIDVCMIEQPLHRPGTQHRNAVLDLLDLLGGMNVDWPNGARSHDLLQRIDRNRAQRMRRDPHARVRERGNDLMRARDQSEEAVQIVEEALLSRTRRRATDAAAHIE